MKKLLDKVNRDIQNGNLEAAISRVNRFITLNYLWTKEAKKRKGEIKKITLANKELGSMDAAGRYEAQSDVEQNIQALAEKLSLRNIWHPIGYAAGLIASLMAIWQFFIKPDPIEDHCPSFIEKKECNFVITKIDSRDDEEFITNQVLTGIEGNAILKDQISITRAGMPPYNTGGIENAKVCIEVCDIKYSIYGDYNRSTDELSYDIIEEGGNSVIPIDRHSYIINDEGLDFLKENLLKEGKGDKTIIYSICTVCEIFENQSNYDALVNNATNASERQYIHNEAHMTFLENDEPERAIRSLDAIEAEEDNRFALSAVEKASALTMDLGNFDDAYKRQTNYVKKVDRRLKYPDEYGVRPKLPAYHNAMNVMRVNRGMNVYRNLDAMNLSKKNQVDYIETAIGDFNYVDSNKYRKEINDLKKRLENLQPKPVTKKAVIINLRNSTNGVNIANASIYLGESQFAYRNGQYKIEKEPNALIGKEIVIEAPQFSRRSAIILAQDLERPKKIDLVPINPNPEGVLRVTVFSEEGPGQRNAMVVYKDEPYRTNANGVCEIKDNEQSFLEDYIALVTEQYGRVTQKITRDHLQNGMTFRLSDYEIQTTKVNGEVINENYEPLVGVELVSRYGSSITDVEGQFSFEFPSTDDVSNEVVQFRKDKYVSKTVPIPDIMRNRMVMMKPRDVSMTYTIKGNLAFCGEAVRPKFRFFNIGDKRVRFNRNGEFNTQIEAKKGTTLDIRIPEEYSLVPGQIPTIDLLENTEISLNVPIQINETFPKKIMITGVAMRDGKPLNGAIIGISGEKGTTKTTSSGSFRLSTTWKGQCQQISLEARNKQLGWNVSNSIYIINAWKGNASKVDFGEIAFKYTGFYVE